MADPADARRRAEEALSEWKTCSYQHDEGCSCGAWPMQEALEALLAAVPEAGVREAFVSGAAWREHDEHGVTICTRDRRRAEEEAERRYPTAEWIESPRLTAAEGRVSELETLLRECNAVCLCGCPDSEHEADECGEGCGHDDHECIRVAKAVLAYVERLRSAAPPPSDAVREAAEAQFGRALLPLWWDDGNPGDIDGSAAQDAAEASGLWRRVKRHADGVECEWCNNEEPCGELTEIGRSALRSDGR